jgi:hypothetical protein
MNGGRAVGTVQLQTRTISIKEEPGLSYFLFFFEVETHLVVTLASNSGFSYPASPGLDYSVYHHTHYKGLRVLPGCEESFES